MRATAKLHLQYPSGMTVHPVLASSTGTQTLEGRGEEKGMGNVYKTRVRNSRKAACAFIIQSSPPLLAIQVCIPAGVGKVRVKRDVYVVMVESIVPDDQRRS